MVRLQGVSMPDVKSLLPPFLLLSAGLCAGCEYARALRPSVLEQLEPPVVRLVNELPGLDRPNESLVARIYATGGSVRAEENGDGSWRSEIWARPGQMIWTPAIVVMPAGGELELTFHNPDEHHHIAYLPSNGDRQVLDLPPRSSGRARLQLNEPGFYWFGCPVANHFGRNMFGFILVEGEVPEEARLDRPPQPLPEED